MLKSLKLSILRDSLTDGNVKIDAMSAHARFLCLQIEHICHVTLGPHLTSFPETDSINS